MNVDHLTFTGRITVLFLVVSLSAMGCGRKDAAEVLHDPQEAAVNTADEKIPEDKEGTDYLPVREQISLDPEWEYADLSVICTGSAMLYRAKDDRKDIVVGVNAGHGTAGGDVAKVYCHPDKSPKITKGTTPAGSLKTSAVTLGMTFFDGTTEAEVTLKAAAILRDRLLAAGYDVLMLRDDEDVQLDNVARTVIANNKADCLISLHWDGDGLGYDKGCFYIPVPDEIKEMEPVASHWQEHERLGECIINSLSRTGCKIYRGRIDPLELTQTCYSTIPAVVIELGNGASAHEDNDLVKLVNGIINGIESFISK